MCSPRKKARPQHRSSFSIRGLRISRARSCNITAAISSTLRSGRCGRYRRWRAWPVQRNSEAGIELVLNLAHGREACAWTDVVITGEGSIDSQTPYGKVPSGIAKLAQSQGKPTIAIGGTVTRDPHTVEALNETGIIATFGIAPGPADLTTLIANTERNVEITCAAIASTLRITAATSPCESA